jgi:hypothetical protein
MDFLHKMEYFPTKWNNLYVIVYKMDFFAQNRIFLKTDIFSLKMVHFPFHALLCMYLMNKLLFVFQTTLWIVVLPLQLL